MKKLMMVAFVGAFLATVARGQETPVADVAVGYSLIQVISGSSISTANGGNGSTAVNFNRWLGAAGDFGLYHASPIKGLAAGTYTFGPRFSYRHWTRLTPFAEVLLGGVRYSANGFVFGTGGGVDIALDTSARFALRQEVEYFGFHANGGMTNTVRVGIGIVFRIGRR